MYESNTATSLPGIVEIQALAAAEMAQVNALIRGRLGSEVILINQISEHIVAAGGKRLRPMLTVIVARALAYSGSEHHQLAAIVEFIHTSTLLHDDVVDESDLRRGRKTANALWGNAPSVLVGDFLYSRSFQLMVELDSMPVMQVLADATNQIAEGEVLQLLHVGNPDTTEADYLRVIERKTAVLFSAATRLSAMLADVSAGQQHKLADYGMNLGLAFQIADDVLDYTADAETLGKNLGDDLAEGKATLPLIHALSKASPDLRLRLEQIIRDGDAGALPEVVAAIRDSGSLDYSREVAGKYASAAEAAIAGLPDNAWTRALHGLARYAMDRNH
jgi:octaprenyl-diphosphate synthase